MVSHRRIYPAEPPVSESRERGISRRGGFSILEALIAILILALVLIGAAPAFFYGAKMMQRAATKRRAVERATDELESVAHRDYEQIRNATRDITLGAGGGSVNGTLTLGVQEQSWDGKKVRVRIEWTLGNSTSDTELSTFVSRVGAGR